MAASGRDDGQVVEGRVEKRRSIRHEIVQLHKVQLTDELNLTYRSLGHPICDVILDT